MDALHVFDFGFEGTAGGTRDVRSLLYWLVWEKARIARQGDLREKCTDRLHDHRGYDAVEFLDTPRHLVQIAVCQDLPSCRIIVHVMRVFNRIL